jgi:hypothetical protein
MATAALAEGRVRACVSPPPGGLKRIETSDLFTNCREGVASRKPGASGVRGSRKLNIYYYSC